MGTNTTVGWVPNSPEGHGVGGFLSSLSYIYYLKNEKKETFYQLGDA